MKRIEINLEDLYTEIAKLGDLPKYTSRVLELAGEGNEITVTGRAPVWLYLAAAHTLHGKAGKLTYSSPASGEVIIFEHTPF